VATPPRHLSNLEDPGIHERVSGLELPAVRRPGLHREFHALDARLEPDARDLDLPVAFLGDDALVLGELPGR
jgi:hypothetical protein